MSHESQLRRFIITRFLWTMFVVSISELVMLAFVNNLLIPLMVSTFFSKLEGLHILSLSNLLVIGVLLILYMILSAIGQFVPSAVSAALVFVNSAFSYLGMGGLLQGNDVVGSGVLDSLDAGEKLALIGVIFAIFAMAAFPYIAGALFFSGVVTKKAAEYERNRIEEQKKDERKRYLMISDIAHDLKTPMTTVSGYSKALSDGMVRPEDEKEYLDAINTKTRRMNEILQLLLDYVKLDSEGFSITPSSTDICELLRECAAYNYQDIEDAGCELEIDVPEEPIMLDLDRLQMMRVINNLITNAIKHNGRETTINISMMSDTDEIRIFVSDSGEKIDDDLAENIFDPFVMGDSSRKSTSGTGLGLSIAKKVLELHGFKIKLVQKPEMARYKLDSRMNKVFVIIIPVNG